MVIASILTSSFFLPSEKVKGKRTSPAITTASPSPTPWDFLNSFPWANNVSKE